MASMMDDTINELEGLLGHNFQDKPLLTLACTHRSFRHENPAITGDNERLEFIGDAALGLIVADILYRRYPDKHEGELSSVRSQLIRGEICQKFTHKLGLEKFLLLGKGEKENNQRAHGRLMANFFEAILGALYLDGGLPVVSTFFYTHFEEEIASHALSPEPNWKSLIQEYSQKTRKVYPTYELKEQTGPGHLRQFTVDLLVGDEVWGTGIASSKKEAEMVAARAAARRQGISGGK